MTFDRAKWLDDTIAEAEADPGAPGTLDSRKASLTMLASLADENGVIQVSEFAEAFGSNPVELWMRWGPTLQLQDPQ